MNYDGIKLLLKNRDYSQALLACEEYIESNGLGDVEILRLRARTFSMLSQHENEFNDWQIILESGQQELKDYYLAGECALNYGEFDAAESYFGSLLKLGSAQNKNWFESAGIFLIAYAQFKLKKLKKAQENICKAIELEPDCAMPVPDIPNLLSAIELKSMIEKSMT